MIVGNLRKGKQAHRSAPTLELVRMMKLYRKNTKITMSVQGDGLELLEHSLPHPHYYNRKTDNHYYISFIIKGNFTTAKGYAYINDILARFALTLPLNQIFLDYVNTPLDDAYDLSQFQGLRSIKTIKDYTKVTSGRDNTFWAIKLYTEALIKENGEGNLVAYSLISAYAHNVFKTIERSTLKAKVRSIWNWYDARGWTIPKRSEKTMEETKMTRSEHLRNVKKEEARRNRANVINLITGLMSNEYKKKSGAWHFGKIAEVAKLTSKTVAKIIKEYENE